MAGDTYTLGNMAPNPATLPVVVDNPFIASDGRAVRDVRADLRKIPSYKNAFSVAWLYGQNIAILWAASWLSHPAAWVLAFLLMGRAHAQFASLMHEAAHRLLFRNKRANDLVGRWLIG